MASRPTGIPRVLWSDRTRSTVRERTGFLRVQGSFLMVYDSFDQLWAKSVGLSFEYCSVCSPSHVTCTGLFDWHRSQDVGTGTRGVQIPIGKRVELVK